MAALSNVQIYDLARAAGFPADVATQMVAIALRESGGNPNAFNGTPPDESYGLWQINVYDSPPGYKARIMAQLGISDPRQLFDPATNARAAASLWGGNPNNLNIAWAINNYGPPNFYAEKYLLDLVPAKLAAATSTYDSPGGGGSPPVILAENPTGGGGGTIIDAPAQIASDDGSLPVPGSSWWDQQSDAAKVLVLLAAGYALSEIVS
jgi:Lysozyme like domain